MYLISPILTLEGRELFFTLLKPSRSTVLIYQVFSNYPLNEMNENL